MLLSVFDIEVNVLIGVVVFIRRVKRVATEEAVTIVREIRAIIVTVSKGVFTDAIIVGDVRCALIDHL